MVDFVRWAYSQTHHDEFIIQDRLDMDYYKLLQDQVIFDNPELAKKFVTFGLINRSKTINLGKLLSVREIKRQFRHVAEDLSVTRKATDWLHGQKFADGTPIFSAAYIEDFARRKLSRFVVKHSKDGDIEVRFPGRWRNTTHWEIYSLAIINELRTRAGLATMDEAELDVFYARAKIKLFDKLERLRGIPGLAIAEFGTRRRHSRPWQEWVIRTMQSRLGPAFTGTSNAYFAMEMGIEAVGTSPHEPAMVMVALAMAGLLGDIGPKEAQYEVLRAFDRTYQGKIRIFLGDAYGTTQFLKGAGACLAAEWAGSRPDSKDPIKAGEEYIAFLKSHGVDPRPKLLVLSDGMDVDSIIQTYAYFAGDIQPGYTMQDFHSVADFLDEKKWKHNPRIRVAYGWGTMATNDFIGCHPRGLTVLDPISVVCKVVEVEGESAVKLSDNENKESGSPAMIKRYRKTFGYEGVVRREVKV